MAHLWLKGRKTWEKAENLRQMLFLVIFKYTVMDSFKTKQNNIKILKRGGGGILLVQKRGNHFVALVVKKSHYSESLRFREVCTN